MKVLVIIGAIVAVLAYCAYYFLTKYYGYFGIERLACNLIHYLGMYASLTLIFIGLAIREENRKLKFLVYLPMVGFFVSLIIIYLLDYITDVLIKTDKPLLTTAASISISLIWYLTERLIKWIQQLISRFGI